MRRTRWRHTAGGTSGHGVVAAGAARGGPRRSRRQRRAPGRPEEVRASPRLQRHHDPGEAEAEVHGEGAGGAQGQTGTAAAAGHPRAFPRGHGLHAGAVRHPGAGGWLPALGAPGDDPLDHRALHGPQEHVCHLARAGPLQTTDKEEPWTPHGRRQRPHRPLRDRGEERPARGGAWRALRVRGGEALPRAGGPQAALPCRCRQPPELAADAGRGGGEEAQQPEPLDLRAHHHRQHAGHAEVPQPLRPEAEGALLGEILPQAQGVARRRGWSLWNKAFCESMES